MAGKTGGRCYPRHLTMKGVGIKQDDASGFLRHADDQWVDDVRQGDVIREHADLTPGFGTRHPQDVIQLGEMSDPSPINQANPENKQNLSKSDLAISDQEIRLSIQEGRAPRSGF
jgi:hypothetical protein